MKIAHSVKITAFAKEDEDEDRIKNKMKEMVPFDIEESKVKLKQKTAIGFNERKINIFEILLEKDKHISMFLDNLADRLSDEAKRLVLKQEESRLDENCNFFLRFSKEKLLEENELWLTNQGNCFHIRINIAAFPKKKEKAMDIIRKLFKAES
ncbi:hypothetical protein GF361_02210 [Candidatus Woesearchaeota archaeon]|nr:hypothetical protein [Candidatus Woesearchaeota archaeon]